MININTGLTKFFKLIWTEPVMAMFKKKSQHKPTNDSKRDKNLSAITENKADQRHQNGKLLSKLERLQHDYRWVATNYEALLDNFENEYIAVMNKKVMFTSKTLEVLFAMILSSKEHIDDFAIEHIKKRPTCLTV